MKNIEDKLFAGLVSEDLCWNWTHHVGIPLEFENLNLGPGFLPYEMAFPDCDLKFEMHATAAICMAGENVVLEQPGLNSSKSLRKKNGKAICSNPAPLLMIPWKGQIWNRTLQ